MSVGHDQKYLKPIYQILRLRGKVIMEEKVQCNEVEGGKIFLPDQMESIQAGSGL
jgi:hypothetical protein